MPWNGCHYGYRYLPTIDAGGAGWMGPKACKHYRSIRTSISVTPKSNGPENAVPGAFAIFSASGAIVPADIERSDIEADRNGILVAEHHALVHRFRHALITARTLKHIRSNGSQKFVRVRRVSREGEPMDKDNSLTVGADIDQFGVIVERL